MNKDQNEIYIEFGHYTFKNSIPNMTGISIFILQTDWC